MLTIIVNVDVFLFVDAEVGHVPQNRNKMTATLGLVVHAAGKYLQVNEIVAAAIKICCGN